MPISIVKDDMLEKVNLTLCTSEDADMIQTHLEKMGFSCILHDKKFTPEAVALKPLFR